jgi:hypothetical protein
MRFVLVAPFELWRKNGRCFQPAPADALGCTVYGQCHVLPPELANVIASGLHRLPLDALHTVTRHFRRQRGAVHIDGDVSVSMQAACASISSNVAAAKGARDWHWYSNKMRELSSFILHPPLPLCLDFVRCAFLFAID